MSLRKKAINSGAWAFTQQISVQGLGFVVSILLARLLEPEEFGLIAMIGIFMGIASSLMDSGLASSLIRSQNLVKDDYSTVFIFNLVGSLFFYVLIYLAAPLIAQFYEQEILTDITRIYAIILIINAFSIIQNTRLTRDLDFKKQLKITLPSILLSSVIGIVMAMNDYGVWSLVALAIAQSFFNTVLLWYWSDWRPQLRFKKNLFKKHFNFGYKLTLSGLLEVLFSNAFVIILGKFFAPAQVGYYNRAVSVTFLPSGNISAVLNKITFPLFSKIQDDNDRLKRAYSKIMQLVIFLVAPTLIFMAVLAEPLFRFLFTDKWLTAVPYFQILCINGILYPLHSYNLNILSVKGRTDLFLKLELIKKASVVVVIGITIPFGIYALLFGSVFLSLLAFVINTHYSGKFIQYSAISQVRDLAPIFFIGLISGFTIWIEDYFILYKSGANDFVRLLVGSLIGLSIYLLLAIRLKMEPLKELRKIINRT